MNVRLVWTTPNGEQLIGDMARVSAPESLAKEWFKLQTILRQTAERTYDWALSNGIAKEVARAVLPEGLTTSRMYVNGTIRSWLHYCNLRTGNGTQKEHMEIAKAIQDILMQHYPNVWKASNESD